MSCPRFLVTVVDGLTFDPAHIPIIGIDVWEHVRSGFRFIVAIG